MTGTRTQVAIFAVGSGLIASGLAIPSEFLPFVIAGGSLAAVGYAITLLPPKSVDPTKILFGKFKKPKTVSPPSTQSSVPSLSSPVTQTSSEAASAGSNLGQSASAESLNPSSSVPETPTIPQKPAKTPYVRLPKTIVEHKIPLSLIGAGLVLVVSAIYFLLPSSPQYAIFTGLFIPGLVLLGLGVLRLYSRPPAFRRFCMNCGFQMLTTDFVCGRCHKQPPSGVDTRACPNCNAVIPTLARFCKDCGAGQPTPPAVLATSG